jgi:hypothetical protein
MEPYIFTNMDYMKMVLVFKINTMAGLAGKNAREGDGDS